MSRLPVPAIEPEVTIVEPRIGFSASVDWSPIAKPPVLSGEPAEGKIASCAPRLLSPFSVTAPALVNRACSSPELPGS